MDLFGRKNGRLYPDGARVLDMYTDQLWLIVNQERRLISTPAVYNALFQQHVFVDKVEKVEESVKTGPAFDDGTCLVRADGDIKVYLLSVSGNKAQRHYIPSLDVLNRYGFDLALCRNVPSVLMQAARVAGELN